MKITGTVAIIVNHKGDIISTATDFSEPSDPQADLSYHQSEKAERIAWNKLLEQLSTKNLYNAILGIGDYSRRDIIKKLEEGSDFTCKIREVEAEI